MALSYKAMDGDTAHTEAKEDNHKFPVLLDVAEVRCRRIERLWMRGFSYHDFFI